MPGASATYWVVTDRRCASQLLIHVVMFTVRSTLNIYIYTQINHVHNVLCSKKAPIFIFLWGDTWLFFPF